MAVTPLTPLQKLSFRLRNIDPPAAHRVSLDDRLYVWWISESGVPVLMVEWKVQDALGEIVIGGESISMPAGVSTNYRLMPVPDGFLLGVTAYTQNVTQTGGQLWVELGLARLFDPYPFPTAVLARGYVDLAHSLAWPPGGLASPHEQELAVRHALITNPGAGNEWTWTVPAHTTVEITALWTNLLTSAVAGTRLLMFDARDGATVLQRMSASATQAASLLRSYSFGVTGAAIGAAGGMIFGMLPARLILQPGWNITSVTTALAGDDLYFSGRITYRRALTFHP